MIATLGETGHSLGTIAGLSSGTTKSATYLVSDPEEQKRLHFVAEFILRRRRVIEAAVPMRLGSMK